MKPISCHRKYAITTNFLDTMLEHSVDIGEGETKLDAYRRGLKELDQIAAELRKEHESMTGVHEVTIGSQWQNQPPQSTTFTTTKVTPPYEIQTDKSTPLATMEAIQSAPTIEVLTTFKILANSDEQLRNAYVSRLKELTK
jgi:hypothetical protein